MRIPKLETAPAAPAAPVAKPSGVLAMLQEMKQQTKAAAADASVQFAPATLLALLPAKVTGFVREGKEAKFAVKDGYVALFDWPAYIDNKGKAHPATLRVAKFQDHKHVTDCVHDDTGLVRDGKGGWFASATREDLALYSGSWDALIAEAKKQNTMK